MSETKSTNQIIAEELAKYYGGRDKSSLAYIRDGHAISIHLRGMTNYEIRDIITGLWARLEEDDKEDHIRALQYYLEPGAVLPLVSRMIAEAKDQGRH